MISVEQLIGDLLLRHNCVIVPSFGGFVAKQAPATIDYVNGTMTPPKKSLLFNRQLINNDGLLIAELAVSNKMNYNEASDFVKNKVEGWNEILRRGERITLDRVGYLFFDQEKNICFEQDRFFNLLLESYGLGTVHFLSETDVHLAQKTVIEKTAVAANSEVVNPAIVFDAESIVPNKEQKEQKIIEHPALKSKTKVWRYVAAACLLPIAFYSFWLPVKTDVLESGMISINDFNPFYHSQEGTYAKSKLVIKKEIYPKESLEQSIAELPEDVSVFSYQFDEDLYIPIRVPKSSSSEAVSSVETQTTTPVEELGSYDYIVGCFGSQENADKLVESLKSKGFDARIVDIKNGLRRISAGNASSESALRTIIEQAKSQGFDGWILNI